MGSPEPEPCETSGDRMAIAGKRCMLERQTPGRGGTGC